MSTSILFAIIISLIGVLIALFDLWKYRNYEMWEDDDGFHMRKKDNDTTI